MCSPPGRSVPLDTPVVVKKHREIHMKEVSEYRRDGPRERRRVAVETTMHSNAKIPYPHKLLGTVEW
jgi:hypothetical protein